jgi:hypothetical protein
LVGALLMKKQKKDQRSKQERALKKRTQRKLQLAQRQSQATGEKATVSSHIRRARSYDFEGCWVQKGWTDDGMALTLVARRQSDGDILFGSYLVDYYCLGVKDTFCNANIPPSRFHQEFMVQLFHGVPSLKIAPPLAHELIYGSIEYAAQLGFRPQRDFKLTQNILDPPDLHPRTGNVKFGKDGKPFFIAGPRDNVPAIMERLRRTAGEGNFDYLLAFSPDQDLEDDEDDEEERPSSPLWTPYQDEEEDDELEEPRPALWTPHQDEEKEKDQPRPVLWTPRQ